MKDRIMLQNAYASKEKYVERTVIPARDLGPEVRKRDSLMMQLEVTQKCLSELHDVISMLEERLSPILPSCGQEQLGRQEMSKGVDSSSTAVKCTTSIIDLIEQNIDRVNYLRNNIEL